MGKTYTGGVCERDRRTKKTKSVTIVEDDGDFSGLQVATHELGHLLGALHDGYYGATGCSKEGNIMSIKRRGKTWSDCSIYSIRRFLQSKKAYCLISQKIK